MSYGLIRRGKGNAASGDAGQGSERRKQRQPGAAAGQARGPPGGGGLEPAGGPPGVWACGGAPPDARAADFAAGQPACAAVRGGLLGGWWIEGGFLGDLDTMEGF